MLIFAHRGASADAPENTLKAFKLALQQGCDGIEIDIHQCRDDFVVIHDKWLHRTTNGVGRFSQMLYSELTRFDAGGGEMIPRLAQVLEEIDGRCLINLEIKYIHNAQTFLDYVHAHTSSHQNILISAFDHHLLVALKRLDPEHLLGALTASKPLSYAAFAEEIGAYSVHVDMHSLDELYVQDAKRRGLKVFAYTVDEQEDLQTLHRWGVDGVFTNRPAYARSILEAMEQSHEDQANS